MSAAASDRGIGVKPRVPHDLKDAPPPQLLVMGDVISIDPGPAGLKQDLEDAYVVRLW